MQHTDAIMEKRPDNMNSIKLVLIGDMHYGADSGCRPGTEVKPLLTQFTGLVNTAIQPKAVVEMGDRINNMDHDEDRRNLELVVEQLDRQLAMPTFHVIKNHDTIFLKKEETSQVFSEQASWRSFYFWGFKFIFLDTVDPLIGYCGGRVGAEQLEWLDKTMQEDETPKLVFGHHPIDHQSMKNNANFTKDDAHLNFVENAAEVRAVLENGKRFSLYCCGHMHWFHFLVGSKGTFVTVPSFTEAYPASKGAPGSFLEMDVYTDGKIEACVRTLNPCRVIGAFTNNG